MATTDDSSAGLPPEQEARRKINTQLVACGWVVQDHTHAAVAAGPRGWLCGRCR